MARRRAGAAHDAGVRARRVARASRGRDPEPRGDLPQHARNRVRRARSLDRRPDLEAAAQAQGRRRRADADQDDLGQRLPARTGRVGRAEVNGLFGRDHRGLLFRSYLFLATGLVVAAVVLDAGFARLAPSEDAWLERSRRLVETELAAAPAANRDDVADRLGRGLGVRVQILASGDLVQGGESGENVVRLTDDSGNVSYLWRAPSLGASVRLGPVPPPRASFLLELLPPLFYLSIFVVVGLWLRPLLRDLDLITSAMQRFATAYPEPMKTRDPAQH